MKYRFKLLLGDTTEIDSSKENYKVIRTKGTISLVKRDDNLLAIVGSKDGMKIFAGYGDKNKMEMIFNSADMIIGFI